MAAHARPAHDRAHLLAVAAATAVPLLIAFVAWRLAGDSTAWVTPFTAAVSVAIAAASLATVVAVGRDVTWLRAGIPAVLLAALVPFIVACRLAANPMRVAAFPSQPHAIALAAILAVAVCGLCARRLWGRWLGLALGAAAIGSGALNSAAFWPATDAYNHAQPAWSAVTFESAWAHFVGVVVGMVIVVNLATARRGFDGGRAHATWTSDAPVIRGVRWLMMASLMAVPMLLVYAWTQPVVPATRSTALALAALLAVGAIAAVRGRMIGALLLTLGGAGLIAQTVATYLGAEGALATRTATYYAVFWLPAGLIALGCSLGIIGATARVLRAR